MAVSSTLGTNSPAAIAERIESLPPERRAMLEARLRHQQSLPESSTPEWPADPQNRYEPFPLTDVQQAYWVGRRPDVELGGVGSHVYSEFDIDDFDLHQLTRAWRKLIDRHEMLRAVVREDGQQQILESVPDYEIPETDLSRLEESARREALAKLRAEMSHQVLPAERWPLFDVRAVRLSPGRARVHTSFDLLIADARSFQVLMGELFFLLNHPDARLPDLTLSYRDCVLRGEALRRSAFHRRDLEYWRARIPHLPGPPQLPLLPESHNGVAPKFERRTGALPRDSWERLKSRAGERGITPSAVLAATYAQVLSTWSKDARFTLNITTFSRPPVHPEINDIVGDFTSLTLLGVDCTGRESFSDCASRLQAQLWSDLEHGSVSGLQVLRELSRKDANGSRTLMPVVFTSTLGLSRGDANPDDAPSGTSLHFAVSQTPQVWLDLQVFEAGGDLGFNWDYVESLFSEELIDGLYGSFCALLERLAANESTWSAPPILTPIAERILQEQTNRTLCRRMAATIHERVVDQVRATPHALAVIGDESTLTYSALDRWANGIAQRLWSCGIRKGSKVPMALEKSPAAVAAALGVMKTGAAYVPLDPKAPALRLQAMVERLGSRIVLVEKADMGAWPADIAAVEVEEATLRGEGLPLRVDVDPSDSAYVIFTSGSTGIPKGVEIDHRGALNTLLDVGARFRVGSGDRVLGLSSLAFDLSVFDLFGSLIHGATLVLPPPTADKDPAGWFDVVQSRRVTIWNSVPALLDMWITWAEERHVALPDSLRLFMLSGDWIPLGLPQRIRERSRPRTRIVSLGGATEASIWSVFHEIADIRPEWKSIPYGLPLENQQLWVLDSKLEPRPVGVPGELFIGGLGLAKGYLGDPDQTRARFLHHPTLGRIYRTGDWARTTQDGAIEFLGREDAQVKIGGHRIELGEIESVLARHADVGAVAVAAQGAERGSKQLVAYIVDPGESEANPRERDVTGALAISDEFVSPEITDRGERLDFKLSAPGIRSTSKTEVPLSRGPRSPELRLRLSMRRFCGGAVSLADMSRFLRELDRSIGDSIRPLLYVKSGRLEGLAEGFFRYDADTRSLEGLEKSGQLTVGSFPDVNQPVFQNAGFAVFFVSDGVSPSVLRRLGSGIHRIESKASKFGIGVCQCGGFPSGTLRELGAAQDSERVLHTVIGGPSTPERFEGWSFAESYGALPLAEESIANLRLHATNCLPEYMIPQCWIRLPSLPLTVNGKVDRANLPHVLPWNGSQPATPASETETTLLNLWRELLENPAAGVEDDFFALGGESLRAVRLMARVCDLFEVDLPLSTLFRHSTVRSLAEALRDAERDGEKDSALREIAPDFEARHQPFPLTEMQQAYWIGRELENTGYHVYLDFELLDLDLERLEEAWANLIQRHDMLRAVIDRDGRQRILLQTPHFEIEAQDLRELSDRDRKGALEQTRQGMSHQVFAPDRWPLFDLRASLIDERRTRLHLSIDMTMGDAWSLQTLLRDLHLFYFDPEALIPLALSFRDYVMACEKLRESNLYQRALQYWNERIPSLPNAPELPLAVNPDSLENPSFVRNESHLSKDRWARLQAKAQAAGLTPSSVLLAAFSEVLAQWSKSPHFVVNVTNFNRLPLHPEVNEILGDFTTITLLEVDASRGAGFANRAKNLQQRLWEDLEHRYVSGVHVIRELNRVRRLPPGALMPVVFTSTLGYPGDDRAREIADRAPSKHDPDIYALSQTPQVWIDHQVLESDDELHFNWDVVDDLFPEGLVADMFSAYCRLLEELSDRAWDFEPELLPRSHAAAHARLNETRRSTLDCRLHELFERSADRAPGRPALITADVVLSYGEVEQRANAVAHGLGALDAPRSQPVAILLPKGWEQIVAALGILKMGGSYLPIDTSLPPARIERLLRDSETTHVVVGSDSVGRLPEGFCAVSFDALLRNRTDRPCIRGDSEDLAYVLYTSGSTGVPKGVMIPHRGALNTVLDVNRRFQVGPEDRVFGVSSLHFDLSVFDVFGTFAAGGALVVPDHDAGRAPDRWREAIRKQGVTIWNSVPALMEMLLETTDGNSDPALDSLRLILLSGDWIPVRLPDRIRAGIPGARVISLGGPTEASIWQAVYPIESIEPEWNSIPYGKPLSNQKLHILGEDLAPRPFWVPGEIYVGGRGLADGYWKQPERTDAVFIRHPDTGERLYRSGDWGRLLPSGEIEFLGRDDFQVQLGGHRVELGEIETTALRHPDVDAVVVTVSDRDSGVPRLAAHVVSERTGLESDESEGLLGDDDDPRLRGTITDAESRLRFKLEQIGIRGIECGSTFSLKDDGEECFERRLSWRSFEDQAVSLIAFSQLIRRLDPMDDLCDLYAVVQSDGVEGMRSGVYRVDSTRDSFEPVAADRVLLAEHLPEVNRPLLATVDFAVFFVERKSVGTEKALHAIGRACHRIESRSRAAGVGICQTGGFSVAGVSALLGLSNHERILHGFVGGVIDRQHDSGWSHLRAGPRAVELPTDFRDELREYLAGHLPSYMIPNQWVGVAKIPLTPNGKVDRNALSVPADREDRTDFVRPSGELERQLSEIVATTLGLTEISVDENFFDLGASSIDLVRVHRRASKLLPDFPVVTLFRFPTVRSVAQHLGDSSTSPAESGQQEARAQKRWRAISANRRKRRSGKDEPTLH